MILIPESGRSVAKSQGHLGNAGSRKTYSKHIINWVRERLWYIDLDECDLEYIGNPSVSPMNKKEVKDFTESVLNELEIGVDV